jgi:hypothetical protein
MVQPLMTGNQTASEMNNDTTMATTAMGNATG